MYGTKATVTWDPTTYITHNQQWLSDFIQKIIKVPSTNVTVIHINNFDLSTICTVNHW